LTRPKNYKNYHSLRFHCNITQKPVFSGFFYFAKLIFSAIQGLFRLLAWRPTSPIGPDLPEASGRIKQIAGATVGSLNDSIAAAVTIIEHGDRQLQLCISRSLAIKWKKESAA